ncbi:hypothetical protein F7R91_00855 [Streptomyces luteolifulvus]|uniref:Uncharacterized protein n=1 Tax=Streptomyces luteolifulvus TaxID=2615112 RepID=A0A6H9V8W5_9ACTN|nr:hypothetical protein [Streptomyces luteolifulvus]KAB1150578.1 hypothetical protein F7R91_00855 [Streptomyces luteolifulvus]
MSTTPQMSQLGQQQGQMFPSTSPYGQQQFGPQQGYGTQQGYGQQPLAMSGSLEQLHQLGQQQPYQQLLQQLGQQGYGQQQHQQMEQQVQQQLQQVTQAAIQQVSAQVLQAGIANGYIDIVQPLPGQPQQIFLRFQDGLRVLNNPTPQAHHEIQEAFAFGHQVVGIWDSASPAILRSVRIQKL